jgi:hypothetical protein
MHRTEAFLSGRITFATSKVGLHVLPPGSLLGVLGKSKMDELGSAEVIYRGSCAIWMWEQDPPIKLLVHDDLDCAIAPSVYDN